MGWYPEPLEPGLPHWARVCDPSVTWHGGSFVLNAEQCSAVRRQHDLRVHLPEGQLDCVHFGAAVNGYMSTLPCSCMWTGSIALGKTREGKACASLKEKWACFSEAAAPLRMEAGRARALWLPHGPARTRAGPDSPTAQTRHRRLCKVTGGAGPVSFCPVMESGVGRESPVVSGTDGGRGWGSKTRHGEGVTRARESARFSKKTS